jgi:hypothetical protein
VAQALGVVHILVSGKATQYRLPEQPGQCGSAPVSSSGRRLYSTNGSRWLCMAQ